MDSQMETTLLHMCHALPIVAFSLRTCPPSNLGHALGTFDDAMLDALSNQAGSPLSEWPWLKTSLSSSRGGLNIRRASLDAAAAYVGFLDQTKL